MFDLNTIVDTIGIKPYYSDDAVMICNADCREVLPLLPDKSIDLVLTDIPFNVNLAYESYSDNLPISEYSHSCEQWFSLFARVAPAFIVKIPTKYSPVVLPIFDRVLGYIWTLIQYSPNATTHGPFNLSLYTQYLVGGQLKKRPSYDVIVNTNNKIETEHPAEMPVVPIKKLVSLFTDTDDIVIDPFMGSGSFIRACKDLGRKSIGIEIEEKYCDIAAKRCSQTVMSLNC